MLKSLTIVWLAAVVASCEAAPAQHTLRGERDLAWQPPSWWPKPNNTKPQCPDVAPVASLDLARWTSASWFIQYQQPTPYQKASQLFCVAATYDAAAGSELIKVSNYGNNGAVNGPSQQSGGSGFSELCAKQVTGGSLKVAPCFLAQVGLYDLLAGPYWVVAVDPEYQWAIVSGGKPNVVKTTNPVTCTTKIGNSFLDTNGSGLWLFTREATGATAEAYSAAMLQILASKGIFAGDLIKVPQEGCTYDGAKLKTGSP
jgi:lipocalin